MIGVRKPFMCTTVERDTILTEMWDRLLKVIFPLNPAIARNRSSGETAIERMPSGCWMRPSRVCVAVSRSVTAYCAEYAMNPPCLGRAMHEPKVLRTPHSETADPVDALICLILLSDMTRRVSLNQRRPVLGHQVTLSGICTSRWPLLLSQTRMESGVAVAIRSPSAEYLAAATTTESPCWSVCARSRAAMSQMEAIRSYDAATSRVESGEKSTPVMLERRSHCEKSCLYVFASHTIASPQRVPAAIHLPSLDTARHSTSFASNLAICLPSSTRHTRTPPSPSPQVQR